MDVLEFIKSLLDSFEAEFSIDDGKMKANIHKSRREPDDLAATRDPGTKAAGDDH